MAAVHPANHTANETSVSDAEKSRISLAFAALLHDATQKVAFAEEQAKLPKISKRCAVGVLLGLVVTLRLIHLMLTGCVFAFINIFRIHSTFIEEQVEKGLELNDIDMFFLPYYTFDNPKGNALLYTVSAMYLLDSIVCLFCSISLIVVQKLSILKCICMFWILVQMLVSGVYGWGLIEFLILEDFGTNYWIDLSFVLVIIILLMVCIHQLNSMISTGYVAFGKGLLRRETTHILDTHEHLRDTEHLLTSSRLSTTTATGTTASTLTVPTTTTASEILSGTNQQAGQQLTFQFGFPQQGQQGQMPNQQGYPPGYNQMGYNPLDPSHGYPYPGQPGYQPHYPNPYHQHPPDPYAWPPYGDPYDPRYDHHYDNHYDHHYDRDYHYDRNNRYSRDRDRPYDHPDRDRDYRERDREYHTTTVVETYRQKEPEPVAPAPAQVAVAPPPAPAPIVVQSQPAHGSVPTNIVIQNERAGRRKKRKKKKKKRRHKS